MSNTKKPNSPWLRGAKPGDVITRNKAVARKDNRRRIQMKNRERYASPR